MHLDSLFIKQAACVAQRMRLNASSDAADQHFRYRTFWVIYFLEKTLSFHHGITSVSTIQRLIDTSTYDLHFR